MPYTPLPTPPWGFQMFRIGYSALVQRQIVWYPQGKADPYWTVYGEALEPSGGNIPVISAILLTSDFEFDPDMENVEDCTGPGRTGPLTYWNPGAGYLDGFANEIKHSFTTTELDSLNTLPSGGITYAGDPTYGRNGNYGNVLGDVRLENRTSVYDPSTGTTLLKCQPFGWSGAFSTTAGFSVRLTKKKLSGGSSTGEELVPLNDGTGRYRYNPALLKVPDLKYMLIYARNPFTWNEIDILGEPGNHNATADPGYGYRNSIPLAVVDLGYQNPKFVEGVTSESERYKFTGDLQFFFKDRVVMRVPGRVA